MYFNFFLKEIKNIILEKKDFIFFNFLLKLFLVFVLSFLLLNLANFKNFLWDIAKDTSVIVVKLREDLPYEKIKQLHEWILNINYVEEVEVFDKDKTTALLSSYFTQDDKELLNHINPPSYFLKVFVWDGVRSWNRVSEVAGVLRGFKEIERLNYSDQTIDFLSYSFLHRICPFLLLFLICFFIIYIIWLNSFCSGIVDKKIMQLKLFLGNGLNLLYLPYILLNVFLLFICLIFSNLLSFFIFKSFYELSLPFSILKFLLLFPFVFIIAESVVVYFFLSLRKIR